MIIFDLSAAVHTPPPPPFSGVFQAYSSILNTSFVLAGENVDTRLEQVDKMTSMVTGVHLSFDLDDNITRIDYFDFEKGANIQRIEQKEQDFHTAVLLRGKCRN